MMSIALLAGCSGREGGDAPGQEGSSREDKGAVEAKVEIPNACTFFSQAELESTVGWELREGKPANSPQESSCRFEILPGMYVKRKYPNPALPQSMRFTSLTVTTYPSKAGDFAEMRRLTGVETPAGVGDDAFFLGGPDFLHVRVVNRGFSVRINTDAASEADRAKLHEVVLGLGKLGASRLR